MALNEDGYQEFAQHGTYGEGGYKGRASYTGKLRKFDIAESTQSSRSSGRGTKVALWDFSGLPDVLDPRICTIAELLLDGCLPEGTTYNQLKQMSPDAIRNNYSKYSKQRMIHVVLYVHAATDPVQENLVEAIGELARDDSREIPVYLIVTKMDLVRSRDHQRNLEANIETISRPMALLGAREKLFKLKLYCDDVSPDLRRIADLDEDLCKLWNRVLSPGYAVDRTPPPPSELPAVFSKPSSYNVPFSGSKDQTVARYQQQAPPPYSPPQQASYSGGQQSQYASPSNPFVIVREREKKEEYHHHHHHHHQAPEEKKKKWCVIS